MFGIRKIEFENTFIFEGHFQLEFPQKGLILIEGINHDAGGSNAAGKTSLFNLIPTALFEQNASGLVKDLIIHRGLKGAFIKIFLSNGIEVFYKRVQGGKSEWGIFQNGRYIEGKIITDTKKIIQDTLKLTYEQYSSAIHLRQGATIGFWEFSPAERMKMISDVMDLVQFEQASQKAKEKTTSLRTELKILENAIEMFDNDIKRIKEEISTREAVLVDISVYKSAGEEIKHKINEVEAKLKKGLKALGELELNMKTLQAEKKTISERLAEKNILLMAKQKNLNELKRGMEVIQAEKEELKALSEKKLDLDFLSVEKKRIETKKEKILKIISGIETQINAHEKVLGLNIADACPICGRPITAGLMEDRKKIIEKEIDGLFQDKKIQENELKVLEKEIKILDSKIREGERLIERIKMISKRLESIDLEKYKTEELELVNQIKIIEKEIEVLKQSLEKSEQEKELHDRFWIVKQEVVNFEHELGKLNQEILEINAKIVDQESQRKRIEELKIELKRKEIERMNKQKEKKELEEETEYYKWWVNGFKKFQALEVAHGIGFLQQALERYSYLLFEDRMRVSLEALKVKKTSKDGLDFKNEIHFHINEGDIPLSGFSGGEKQLLALVFMMALNDLIQSKLVILDEVFGSLDDINRERVVRLIREVADRKLVLVVTHIDEVKTMAEWDHIIQIERKNGASRVSMI